MAVAEGMAKMTTHTKALSTHAGRRKKRGENAKKRIPGDQRDKQIGRWKLRLYIAGETSRSIAAMRNLQSICTEHLADRYQVEVIDLLKNPTMAEGDQILAIPTLVRRLPPPLKRIIGDLSNIEKVLLGLDVRPERLGTATRKQDE
jgi:circadian clock protein KaiB